MKKILFILVITSSLCAQEYASFFQALPDLAKNPANEITDVKVQLGKKLYLDNRLSLDNDISCNSCHQLDNYGVDSKPTSPGHKGQLGDRNSPTVYNAALHFAQFWDGRAKDVEEQALGPVMNPVEMAMPSEAVVVERLTKDPEYQKLFAEAFPGEGINFKNMGKAIAAFERTLITPSRFDQYLKGDTKALTDAEKTGLKTFVETGCIACHSGALLGGNMYQKFGLVKPYTAGNASDPGRAKVTGNPAEDKFFKVPSLRNIAKTGPYFHDGHISDLKQAVSIMSEYQLGKKLTPEQVDSIVTFLNALTADIK